jgi:hypothetical protein
MPSNYETVAVFWALHGGELSYHRAQTGKRAYFALRGFNSWAYPSKEITVPKEIITSLLQNKLIEWNSNGNLELTDEGIDQGFRLSPRN